MSLCGLRGSVVNWGGEVVDQRGELEGSAEPPRDHFGAERGVGGLAGDDIHEADPLAGNRVYHHVPVLAQEPDRDAARSFPHHRRPQGSQADRACRRITIA